MRTRKPRFVLPVTQRSSQGWGVQWRRGNAHRDTYEVVYRGQYEGGVVVTREGWKWYRRSLRGWRARIEFGTAVFPTWEAAVTDLARRFRRTDRGRGAKLPTEWGNATYPRREPWTPRPIHDTFDAYFAAREPS